jgi:hypothetical protein
LRSLPWSQSLSALFQHSFSSVLAWVGGGARLAVRAQQKYRLEIGEIVFIGYLFARFTVRRRGVLRGARHPDPGLCFFGAASGSAVQFSAPIFGNHEGGTEGANVMPHPTG